MFERLILALARMFVTTYPIHGTVEAMKLGPCDYFPSIVCTTGLSRIKVGGLWYRVDPWTWGNNHPDTNHLPQVGQTVFRQAGSREILVAV